LAIKTNIPLISGGMQAGYLTSDKIPERYYYTLKNWGTFLFYYNMLALVKGFA